MNAIRSFQKNIVIFSMLFLLSPSKVLSQPCAADLEISHDYQSSINSEPCTIFGRLMILSKTGDYGSLRSEILKLDDLEGITGYYNAQMAFAYLDLTEDLKDLRERQREIILTHLSFAYLSMTIEEERTHDDVEVAAFYAYLALLELLYNVKVAETFWDPIVSQRDRSLKFEKNSAICVWRNYIPNIALESIYNTVDYLRCMEEIRNDG